MLEILLSLAAGLLIGGGIVWVFQRQVALNKQKEIDEIKQSLDATQQENKSIMQKNIELEKLISKQEAEHKAYQKDIELLEKTEKRLKVEFENLSNKILEDRSEKFKKQNKEALGAILGPLHKQIESFNQSFINTDKGFTEKFGELKEQIINLAKLNVSIGEQAENLTSALKGDSKQQGNWGELILEKTLEMSGLREGVDYKTQVAFKDDDGQKIIDVIVYLPDKKDIVIDSKVSLKDYDAYFSAEDEEQKALFLKQHIKSVENHINNLSRKGYQNISELRTLNYVLMFIPIEPAYILTINTDKDIFEKALHKNIVLVCPSTLLAVLRTVNALWQLDKQSKHAKEIVEKAGRVYDKLVVVVEKMHKMGQQLNTVQTTYDDTLRSLNKGRNNLISQADAMKQLGAKTTKSLPSEIVEDSEHTDPPP